MTNELFIAEVPDTVSPLFARANAIYLEAFGPEDRMPPDDFALLAGMGLRPQSNIRGHFWVFGREQTADGTPQVEGMAIFSYNRRRNLAFLSYFAVDAMARSGGIGAAALRLIVAQVTRDGLEASGKAPDGLFWEVHPPDDPAVAVAVRQQNVRRIAFYTKQGAHILPIDYTIPSDIPELPYVRYLIFYFPIALPLNKVGVRTLRKIVNAGLRDEYELPPDHPYVQKALASIQPKPRR